MSVADKVVYRQQFDRCDAEINQIVEHGRSSQGRIGSAHVLRYVGMPGSDALDVKLVDDGSVPRCLELAVASPREGRIDHNALGHVRCVVSVIEREIAIGVADPIAEHGVRPFDVAGDGFGIGIDQQFLGIEPMPLLRFVGAMHPIAIMLARPESRHIHMPDLVGAFLEANAVGFFRRVWPIKQAQFHRRRVLRKEREVDTLSVPRCTERIGTTWPHS